MVNADNLYHALIAMEYWLTAASSRKGRSKEDKGEEEEDINVKYGKELPNNLSSYCLLKVVLNKLGPGIITGACDADPSGIATYSQAGAQFGFGMA